MRLRTFLAPTLLSVALATTVNVSDAQSPAGQLRHGLAVTHAEQIAGKNDRPFAGAEQANWTASVDLRVFEEITNAEGFPARATNKPIIGNTVDVVLPGKGRVSLRVTGITELVEGVTTLSGVLADDSESIFTLSIEGDRVLGSIRDRTHNWVIEPNGSTHRLRKIERSLIPRVPDVVVDSPEGKEKRQVGDASAKTGGSGRVDVLFLHANNVSNPSLIASDIISNMNSAFSTSLVSSNNYVASAGVQLIDDDFDNDSRATILNLMRFRQAPFDHVMTDLMFAANADIAFLIVEEDAGATDFPGFGRVGGAAIPFVDDQPFGLSTDDYALGDIYWTARDWPHFQRTS